MHNTAPKTQTSTDRVYPHTVGWTFPQTSVNPPANCWYDTDLFNA